jgi:hypothetical protein
MAMTDKLKINWPDISIDQWKLEELMKAKKEIEVLERMSETEIDYEPITIDRRRDLDYIEKLAVGELRTLLTLAELVAQGKADFLFIEYPEISDYWHKHCTNLGKLRAKEAAVTRNEELKKSALSKLTEEEKKALGIE